MSLQFARFNGAEPAAAGAKFSAGFAAAPALQRLPLSSGEAPSALGYGTVIGSG